MSFQPKKVFFLRNDTPVTDTASLVFSIQWLHRGHGANDSSPYRRHKKFLRLLQASQPQCSSASSATRMWDNLFGNGWRPRRVMAWLDPFTGSQEPVAWRGGGIAVLCLWMKSYSKHELNETNPLFLSPKVTIELQWNECLLENGSSLHAHLTKLVIWTWTPLRRASFLRSYTSLLLFLQTQRQAEQHENRVLICGSDSECVLPTLSLVKGLFKHLQTLLCFSHLRPTSC